MLSRAFERPVERAGGGGAQAALEAVLLLNGWQRIFVAVGHTSARTTERYAAVAPEKLMTATATLDMLLFGLWRRDDHTCGVGART
jgi:hypothetical protein